MSPPAGRIASVAAGYPEPHRTVGPASPAILVVDDEPSIVDVIAFLLEDEGYRVLRAYDGEQAWGIVSARCPDLIISDVYMPHLNGLDFLKRLRRRPPLSRIPVILMSAARRDLIVPNAAFVAKPFDLERMLSLVNAALATR
ncbi:MAG: response regulator [Chloroflexota bacterium]|nr:response regulator [Chloroflexota bacterium]